MLSEGLCELCKWRRLDPVCESWRSLKSLSKRTDGTPHFGGSMGG